MKQRKSVICPKCRKPATELIEYWINHSTSYGVDGNGLWDRKDGYHEPGDAYRVDGCCSRCNYQWRLRGVRQIINVEAKTQ